MNNYCNVYEKMLALTVELENQSDFRKVSLLNSLRDNIYVGLINEGFKNCRAVRIQDKEYLSFRIEDNNYLCEMEHLKKCLYEYENTVSFGNVSETENVLEKLVGSFKRNAIPKKNDKETDTSSEKSEERERVPDEAKNTNKPDKEKKSGETTDEPKKQEKNSESKPQNENKRKQGGNPEQRQNKKEKDRKDAYRREVPFESLNFLDAVPRKEEKEKKDNKKENTFKQKKDSGTEKEEDRRNIHKESPDREKESKVIIVPSEKEKELEEKLKQAREKTKEQEEQMSSMNKQLEELKEMGNLMKNLQEQLKNAEQEKQSMRQQMQEMANASALKTEGSITQAGENEKLDKETNAGFGANTFPSQTVAKEDVAVEKKPESNFSSTHIIESSMPQYINYKCEENLSNAKVIVSWEHGTPEHVFIQYNNEKNDTPTERTENSVSYDIPACPVGANIQAVVTGNVGAIHIIVENGNALVPTGENMVRFADLEMAVHQICVKDLTGQEPSSDYVMYVLPLEKNPCASGNERENVDALVAIKGQDGVFRTFVTDKTAPTKIVEVAQGDYSFRVRAYYDAGGFNTMLFGTNKLEDQEHYHFEEKKQLYNAAVKTGRYGHPILKEETEIASNILHILPLEFDTSKTENIPFALLTETGYFTNGSGSELEDVEYNSDVTNAMTQINWNGSNGMKVVSVKWEKDNLVASIN